MPQYVDVLWIMNVAAVIIMIGVLVHFLSKKEKRETKDRIFIALLIAVMMTALPEIVYAVIKAGSGFNMIYSICETWLMTFIEHVSCMFMAVWLFFLAGYGRAFRKYRLLFIAPLAAELIYSVLTIAMMIRLFDSTDSFWSFMTNLSYVLYFVGLAYIVVSLIMLWRIDKALMILPVILTAVLILFDIIYGSAYSRPMLMALVVLYLYMSMKKQQLLVHIGGIMLILFTVITLFIGNAVTSAAFSSYLKTLHDRNDEHLKDVENMMESYEALPWLIDYWTDNAASVRFNLENRSESTVLFNVDLKSVSSDEASLMDDNMQLQFATACYKRIDDVFVDEYETYDLDDLFLIIRYSDDDAVKLFDAEKNPDGTYGLGDDFDVYSESFEWGNYETEVSEATHWTWGRYSEDDDFGFYRKLPESLSGKEALLCNSFKRSEIYAHMDYISSFRLEAMGYLIVVAAIILMVLYFMILRPLSFMSSTMKRYRHDKDEKAVKTDMARISQHDEIGAFANDFTSLTGEMKRYTEEVAHLAKESERVATELRMAADIQIKALPSVFPAFPENSEFDIYAHMTPAKEVGGDFYDFFMTDERHLAFLMADVSDKGVPAALFMMSAKNLINYRAQEGGTPGQILTAANEQLCKNNQTKMFATVWMGILDLDTGVITCANAGHERPAVSDKDGGFSLIPKDDHGPAIGVLPGITYKDYEITLSQKESIFLYTDGVPEAKNGAGDFYGAQQMILDLADIEEGSPKWIIENLTEQIDTYVQDAEQFDDMTMLCLKYYGDDVTDSH